MACETYYIAGSLSYPDKRSKKNGYFYVAREDHLQEIAVVTFRETS